jgi:hypothetical protein
MVDDNTSSQVIAFSGNTMVYESVKRFAIKALNELMHSLMDNVDDALFEFAKKAETDNERNLYFEAMRNLRLNRKNLERDFDAGIKRGFDALITNEPSKQAAIDEGELSLVDQSEVEDQLAIDNMITKALPQFEDDLYAVEERLKVILHRSRISKGRNPLNPQTICESFHAASAQLDIDIRAKLVFYKLFDKHVLSRLGEFYRQLNDYFVQKGVLPEFRAADERMRQTTRFMADLRQRERRESATDEYTPGETATPAAAAQTAPASGEQSVLSILRQALGLSDPGPSGAVSAPAGLSGGLAQAGEAGAGAGSSGTFAVPGEGQGVPIVSALTGLQSAPLNFQPLMTVVPADMKAHMATQIADFRAANSANPAEKQAIDMISMLFDFFFDDRSLPDPIKVLIGRLQIPILKVALLDEHFFNSRKHPARRFLDAISRVALGWSQDPADQQPLVERLETLIEQLLQDFDEDVGIFEQALQALDSFMQQEDRRTEQALASLEQQEAERDEKIRQAEHRVDAFLDSLEHNRDFSFAVIDFLRGLWRKVLFNTLVSEGEESTHWRNLQRISSTLVWTLVPRNSEKGRLKLLKTLPHLLKALSQGMQLINVDQQQQDEVFQILVHEHAGVVKQTARNIAAQAKQAADDADHTAPAGTIELDLGAPSTTPDDGATLDHDPVNEVQQQAVGEVIHNLDEFTQSIVNGSIHIDEEIVMDSSVAEVEFDRQAADGQDDYVEQARALELGTWVEFDDQEGGAKSLHAKLSWKSNITGKYIFVDRLGHKVRNLTVYGYAAELRAGRAHPIQHVSFFDRAINSVLSGVRH